MARSTVLFKKFDKVKNALCEKHGKNCTSCPLHRVLFNCHSYDSMKEVYKYVTMYTWRSILKVLKEQGEQFGVMLDVNVE